MSGVDAVTAFVRFAFSIAADGWKDYGDLSAVEPPYSIAMRCDNCKTKWLGCWDNFECPECGEGTLPSCEETP